MEDTGPAPYADGPAEPLNDYEFLYTVTENDTVLAIASRFRVQTMDVVRVNFPCRDPMNVQPGDVLHVRWPQPYEVVGIGEGC
ncbi:LysM peptidoglycan-binding domain-containing protein [Herbiconiux daphne]|uniref:LysM domain-containing protein n=1 Tax=Herbiconiux daphne TaxID=2970914 RepID=A0ABT2H6K5_9MICO|nr:LysM domain-containing protein [Herbiconiux daphne]MCS5735552.1 LysM domain-containing protein [Herbiconiux daphne]